jgi:hypothetical protein
MKGDFTRDTFDPAKHFTRVLMQQGRVQLDADWNEQGAILLHYLQALATDLIGPFGGPEGICAFGLFANSADPKKNLQLSNSEKERLTKDLEKGDFLIGKGRYYVDGLLCENEDHVRYTGQPNPPAIATPLKADSDFYLVYLDVWEHHITYLEDENSSSIREVALGGLDTATRAKIVWQVKAWTGKPPEGTKAPNVDQLNTNWKAWLKFFDPENRGQLKVEVKAGTDLAKPCLTQPDARYRGAENQLYRVEIHQGGKAVKAGKRATFKWSRENGSVVFPIDDINEDVIKLGHLGRDGRLGLKVGDWVEIVSDKMVLRGQVAPMVQVDSIEPVDFTVQIKPREALAAFDHKKETLLLRRWDHKGDVTGDGAVLLTESLTDWVALEDGLQIQFQPDGEYRSGDYWLIPARTLTGDVEWPKDKEGPQSRPPHGIEHHYAPLAVIRRKAETAIDEIEDCRRIIQHAGRPVT